MTPDSLLTEERRARMAAERLLAQKEAELHAANRKLSRHAIHLSEEVVEKREEVEAVRGENALVRADLDRANTEVDIAKRRLWNSIQSIEDGFAVFDADSRMVIANSAFLQPFDGLECIRPGAHYQEVVEAALAEGVVDIEGLSPGQWREEMLARWFSSDPAPRVIRLWDGTWIRLVDQRAPGGDTVCLGLNITEAMKREAALDDARERAEAANRAKSAFLANMSHEIRTPMNGVVGMADLLAESDLDGEQRLYVDTIRSSGQSLLTIINDVLDYSKIEARKFTLHPEPFDLEQVVLDVIHLMAPMIRSKGLKIMLDYDMFLPTRFEGDPVRLRQVLTNLVGNAVKFTERGHVLVRVVGLPATDGTPYNVHLTVEDTGIGIPAEKLDHVFGQFNQVEDERNRAFEGTGLGLAISRELIGLMNGRIWVDSEPGVGSSFGVQVPLTVLAAHEPARVPDWLNHVLLVMDDPLARPIFEKRLAALGLTVTALPSTDDSISAVAAQTDAILADIQVSAPGPTALPDVLRAKGASAPLVLISRDSETPTGAPEAAATLSRTASRVDLVKVLGALPSPAQAALSPADRDPVPASDETSSSAMGAEPETRGVDAADADITEKSATVPPGPQDESLAPAGTSAPTIEPVFGSRRMSQPAAAQSPQADPIGLPDSAAPQDLSIAAEPAEPAQALGALRPMRVLAAEDNKTNQLVFSKLVKTCDIDLLFANNGAEAVEAFEHDRPDLIFMDISMPGMDGKEATRRIREIEAAKGLPHTRIVALTAHAMDGDAEEIMAHGLDAHLTKPFKKPAILAEIENAAPQEARAPLPASD